MKIIILIILSLGFASSGFAENIAIKGGTAYISGSEKIDNATVLIKDGKIASVVANGQVPSGYRIVDAKNQWVTVGLMLPESNIGLVEVSSSAGIVDHRLSGSEKNPIAYDVTWALNPDTTLIPTTRIEGITRAATGFSGGGSMWRGQGAIIHLGNGSDITVKSKAYIGLNVSGQSANSQGGSRAALWHKVIKKLEDAKPTPEDEDTSSKANAPDDDTKENGAKTQKKNKPDAEKEVLKKLLAGEMVLVVNANRASDIRHVITLQKRFGLNIVLKGAAEAWRVAAELAEADISVIVDATSNLPGSFESLGSTQKNAAILNDAGVKIAFSGDENHNARLMPQKAGNAVANGLPWAKAFDAMTKNPAEIFGIADSYGTLEAGKVADVVIWSGDPIEITTAPTHVFIAGEEIDLSSRQTKLRDRYLTLKPHPQIRD